jgi:hypothetical protein
MRDFYAWGAFFADLEETAVGVQNPKTLRPVRHDPEQTVLDERIEALQRVMATQTPELDAAQVGWEKNLKKLPGVWTLLEPVSLKSQTDAELESRDDGSLQLAEGQAPERDEYTLDLMSDMPSRTYFTSTTYTPR